MEMNPDFPSSNKFGLLSDSVTLFAISNALIRVDGFANVTEFRGNSVEVDTKSVAKSR
jgi:hypothetical protein